MDSYDDTLYETLEEYCFKGKNIIVAIADINTRNFTNNVILELFIAKKGIVGSNEYYTVQRHWT